MRLPPSCPLAPGHLSRKSPALPKIHLASLGARGSSGHSLYRLHPRLLNPRHRLGGPATKTARRRSCVHNCRARRCASLRAPRWPFVVVTSRENERKAALHFDPSSGCYVVLLDPAGRIVWPRRPALRTCRQRPQTSARPSQALVSPRQLQIPNRRAEFPLRRTSVGPGTIKRPTARPVAP